MVRNPTRSYGGFSSLELAITLCVIALMIAGITIGRSLVDSASSQAAIADFEKLRQAALNYRDKYGQLPGDHTGATALTSSDAGCPTPAASDTATTATCNGNGDGFIGDTTGDPMGAFSNYQEALLAWQHLSNDGLIPGAYNGRRTTASNEITFGVNMPANRSTGGGYMLRYFPTNTITNTYITARYGHVIFYGKPSTSAALPLNGSLLTTEQAKSIDQKIDDGKPGMGKVLSTLDNSLSCYNAGYESTITYNASTGSAVCALIFVTGF